MIRTLLVTIVIVFILVTQYASAGETRSWTGSNGKVIEAELLGLDGEVVKLKLKNGKESNVLISLFSKEDQEYIRKIDRADNPFGDESDVNDPDKFAKPETVRFTFGMSEKGNGIVRLEKIDGKQREDDFDGKTVAISDMPNLDLKRRADGISKLILDFKKPLPDGLGFGKNSVDPKKRALLFQPRAEEWDGRCLFGLKKGMCQLPLKISYDATVTHRGECCNMEFVFSDCVLICHVFSVGKKFGDDITVRCSVGYAPIHGQWSKYDDMVNMKNIVLDEPFSSSFPVAKLKGKGDEMFRGGIGRNLNLEKGEEISLGPLAIERLSFEGRLTVPPKNQ